MLRSLTVGAYDCNATGRYVESWDFPDARLNAFGASAQSAGASRYESHYDDASWQFTQVFTAGSTRADIDAFTAALTAGAMVALGEDTGTASTRLVSVDSTITSTTGFTRVLVSGTRRPAWRDAPYPFSLAVAGGMGTAAAPKVGGSIAAELNIDVFSTGNTAMLALGIKHAPKAGYSPHIGTIDTWAGAVSLSATPATLFAGAALDVAAHRGSHIGVLLARHDSSSGTVKYRLGSTFAGASAPCSYPVTSNVIGTAAGEMLTIGEVSIPAATLPFASDGVVYGAQVNDVRQDSVGNVLFTGQNVQTFKPGITGLLTALQLHGTTLGNEMEAYVFRGDTHIGVYSTHTGQADTWIGLNSANPPVVTAGETLRLVPTVFWALTYYAGGSTYTAGELNANPAWDLAFRTYIRPARQFTAATPVTATCSVAGKTAATCTLSLIPTDAGCIIAAGTFTDVAGWRYDAATRAVYPLDTLGVSGPALTSVVREGEMALPVGDNTFVVRGYINDITLTGTITEQRITRG